MNLIYVVNDISLETKIIGAETISTTLLNIGYWIYGPSAPNLRKVRSGDKAIIYLAGKDRRFFIASFQIASEVSENNNLFRGGDEERYLNLLFPLATAIKAIRVFTKPCRLNRRSSIHYRQE